MKLWLTDRSRYSLGLQKCLMARYLRYHSMNGYGIQKVGQSLPLATGTFVHEALAEILSLCRGLSYFQGVTDDHVEKAIGKAIDKYKASIKERGYHDLPATENARIVDEQCRLLEGLIWSWYYHILPGLIAKFEILEVEREELYDVDESIAIMSRPDYVARNRDTDEVGIGDFKTTAYLDDSFIEQWRESIQMAVGTLGVEKRLGVPVTHYYIQALQKGIRKNEYNTVSKDYDGEKRQNSIYAYAYRREGNPPLTKEDWQPKWKYFDGEKNRTLGQAYEKQSTGLYPGGVKAWVKALPASTHFENHALIGPFYRQVGQLQQLVRGIKAHETEWVNKLWTLHSANFEWSSEAFQEQLDATFPRSYKCIEYGSRCEFYELCFKHPGWADPLATGKYALRRPHHLPEEEQMVERGLQIPQDLAGPAEQD